MHATLKMAHAGPVLPPGTRLGDFVVDCPIGEGGMGRVYRARQESLGGRIVSLKVVPREKLDREAEGAFRLEAAAAAELHHPHLAEVYGFGITDGQVFYAMRLVEGPTLQQVLNRLAQSGDQARRDRAARRRIVQRVAEVASALALVHARGFVHRDVKPGNIVIAGRGRNGALVPDHPCVLVDFGLVRAGRSEGTDLAFGPYGTPAYLAPDPEPDQRSDVFALGVTLHDLLAARRANERDPPGKGLEPIEELVPEIDRDLAAVVGMACDPNPAWRYANGGEMLADLEAWIAGMPVRARRLALVEKALRWVKRHPGRLLRWAAIAVGMLVFAALLAVPLGYAERARKAKSAEQRGSLLELGDSLRAIPAWAASLILTAPLRELRSRLVKADAGSEQDGLREAYERLARGDPSGAAAAAVDHLIEQGLAEEPLLVRFLAAAIRGEAVEPENPRAEPLRAAALAQTARLARFRPEFESASLEASAPIWQALREFHERAGTGRAERSPLEPLQAIAALSGFGRPEDIVLLLDRAWEIAEDSEERRLALAVVARILRRSKACGWRIGIERQPWWPACQEWILETCTRWWLRGEAPPKGTIRVWPKLTEAVLWVQRWEQGASLIDTLMPQGVVASLERADRPEGPSAALTALCVADASRARKVLDLILRNTASEWRTQVTNSIGWGRLCGYAQDPGLAEVARSVLAQVAEIQADREQDNRFNWLPEAFDQGLAAAQDSINGVVASSRAPSGSVQLELQPLDGSRADLLQDLGFGRIDGALLQWCFFTGQAAIEGDAGNVRLAHCDVETNDSGVPTLRLDRPGHSEARLEFVLQKGVRPPIKIGLSPWAEAVDHMPFLGDVRLEVRLDDQVLDSDVPVANESISGVTLDLPDEWIRSGRHEIVIRLRADSSAGCRITRVWVQGS